MSRHKRPNIQTADSIAIDPDCHDLEIIPRELSLEMDPSTGSSDMLFDLSVSDYVLDEKIENYKSYLRNLNTNDGGVKLKLHLERLEKEKARRELPKKTGCQAQVIDETNASAQLSDKRDCLDSEVTHSNAWLASPNGRFGPSSGQECSPFSPKSSKSESMTKLCSQTDRSANKIRHANDLEGSSSEVKHGVCPSCCQKPPSSKISADTNGEQNQFLCTQCKLRIRVLKTTCYIKNDIDGHSHPSGTAPNAAKLKHSPEFPFLSCNVSKSEREDMVDRTRYLFVPLKQAMCALYPKQDEFMSHLL